jgi:hypothetical protein
VRGRGGDTWPSHEVSAQEEADESKCLSHRNVPRFSIYIGQTIAGRSASSSAIVGLEGLYEGLSLPNCQDGMKAVMPAGRRHRNFVAELAPWRASPIRLAVSGEWRQTSGSKIDGRA